MIAARSGRCERRQQYRLSLQHRIGGQLGQQSAKLRELFVAVA
jgi:hypothetical protein